MLKVAGSILGSADPGTAESNDKRYEIRNGLVDGARLVFEIVSGDEHTYFELTAQEEPIQGAGHDEAGERRNTERGLISDSCDRSLKHHLLCEKGKEFGIRAFSESRAAREGLAQNFDHEPARRVEIERPRAMQAGRLWDLVTILP